jgi:hypothetical protein
MQTIQGALAEAFAVLVALLLSTDTGPIYIYLDSQKLVNIVNWDKLILHQSLMKLDKIT